MNLYTLLFLVSAVSLLSQSNNLKYNSSYIPYYQEGHNLYHTADRLDINQDSFVNVHSSIRKLSPTALDRLSHNQAGEYLFQHESEEPRKGLFNTFYKQPDKLYEVRTSDFSLGINLVANFQLGYEKENDELIYLNKRGLEIYGRLDEKIYFYSTIHENQSNFFNYQQPFIEQYKTIRGQGNYKDYQSSVIDRLSGYDYGFIQAYMGIQISRHTKLEFGHDRHFVGNGIRSLLLSDSGNNYFFLKFDVNVWRLHYQTILAELSTISARYTPNNSILPKKYMAAHYFSYKPRKNIEFGVFEGIVFSRENNFELQYLNPVIFYRTIEHQLDSPDNVLIGLNAKWNLFHQFSAYGQLLLDELNIGELRAAQQWWGNKYGLQLGLKYIDVLNIPHLDMQLEWNKVRPFTYSHREPNADFPEITVTNYSHYLQPLAHPLGANFTESIFKLRYRPTRRLLFSARILYTEAGRNTDINYGAVLTWPNVTRNANYGIAQNQGALSRITMINLDCSYEVLTNLHLDLQLMQRKDENTQLADYNTTYLGTGLRYNVSNKRIDY